MSPNDEPATPGAKGAAAEARKGRGGDTDTPASPDLVSITLDAATCAIVRLERVDAAGAHHEISEDDRTRLGEARATLERLIEQAFEAGIDCVLGDSSGEAGPSETAEDAELSGMLLRSLLQGSPASRLTQGDVLGPAIVGALFSRAAAERPASPESAATH
jgi:hypothetical protein